MNDGEKRELQTARILLEEACACLHNAKVTHGLESVENAIRHIDAIQHDEGALLGPVMLNHLHAIKAIACESDSVICLVDDLIAEYTHD